MEALRAKKRDYQVLQTQLESVRAQQTPSTQRAKTMSAAVDKLNQNVAALSREVADQEVGATWTGVQMLLLFLSFSTLCNNARKRKSAHPSKRIG
jgi:hypothetical protein